MPTGPRTEVPAEPWRSFLSDLDAILDEPADLHCIGGFAISQYFGFGRETRRRGIARRSTCGSSPVGPK
jgi:hypothetical protein